MTEENIPSDNEYLIYKNTIEDYVNENSSLVGVAFIKIDSDDIYELAIIEDMESGAALFTIIDEDVVRIETEYDDIFGSIIII